MDGPLDQGCKWGHSCRKEVEEGSAPGQQEKDRPYHSQKNGAPAPHFATGGMEEERPGRYPARASILHYGSSPVVLPLLAPEEPEDQRERHSDADENPES